MSVLFKPFRALAWNFVKGVVSHKFPNVQSISTEKLAAWLTSELPPPVLIDARKAEEYAVSHLPGARHLQTVEAVQGSDIAPDAALVVYCSVGYRSARLAQKLQAAGYDHVMNLEGSIFEWHNRGHPIVSEGKPVRHVHPYNRTWRLLLESAE